MYKQILTNKDGKTVKVLSHHQEIYIISLPNDHKRANDGNFTKEDLIACGFIFPVKKWTPEIGEDYYVPNLSDVSKYDSYQWNNDGIDERHLANNLVCRTKEEAIALIDKMLGVIK